MTTAVRVTQAALDILAGASAGDADVEVTQLAVEVLFTPDVVSANVTQGAIEIIFTADEADVMVTTAQIEVMRIKEVVSFGDTISVVDSFDGGNSSITISGWADNILGDDEAAAGMEISANAMQGATLNASNNSRYVSGASAGPDMEMGVTVLQLPASGQTMSLWGRIQDAETLMCGYEMRVCIGSAGVNNDQIEFFRYNETAPTKVSSTITLNGHLSAGDELGFKITGAGAVVLEATRKGPLMVEFEIMARVSDPGAGGAVSGPGECGVGIKNGAEREGRMDDVKCGPPFAAGGPDKGGPRSSGVPPGGAFASGFTRRI